MTDLHFLASLCMTFELFTVNKRTQQNKSYCAYLKKYKTQTCHSQNDITTLSQTPITLFYTPGWREALYE